MGRRKVIVDGREIFRRVSFAHCEAIDFLGYVRYGHGRVSFIRTHGCKMQILLHPAQRKFRVVIPALDVIPLRREKWRDRGQAEQ